MANISRVRSRKRSKGEICRLVAPIVPTRQHQQPLNLCVRDPVLLSTLPLSAAAVPIVTSLPSSSSSEFTSTNGKLGVLQRRRKKRSAIFLPPERLADNDVCICKFKFVAGNQPRLQEKKVLSVDSGGNFRFFPELQPNSASATGPPPPPPPAAATTSAPGSKQLLNKQKLAIPDLLPISVSPYPKHTTLANAHAEVAASGSGGTVPANNNKKLSRRQKMEQTFGEKGFLIQTQHVPATAGSAFSKFRQLKKFTRYFLQMSLLNESFYKSFIIFF